MHGTVLRRDTTAETASQDLREVNAQMLAAIDLGIDSHAPMLNAAKIAALYHLKAGGQRIRARLALDSSYCLGLTQSDGIALATTAELLHNASLIHDDLQDRDKIRRELDTVWVAYGDEVAICAGDLLLSAAYGALADISCADKLPQLIKLVHSRVAYAIGGQCADLSQASTQLLGVDGYLKIATAKSGALLSLPIELALLAADCQEGLGATRAAVDSFAVGYQIYDDLCDFEADRARDGFAATLNIVQVLQVNNAVSTRAAWERAKQLGLQKLAFAAADSANIPMQSGRLLRELSNDLYARLTERRI